MPTRNPGRENDSLVRRRSVFFGPLVPLRHGDSTYETSLGPLRCEDDKVCQPVSSYLLDGVRAKVMTKG